METNNQLPLVSFEQAKSLEGLGFDWDTESMYDRSGRLISSFNKNSVSDYTLWYLAAPTIAHALMFMRVKKGIPCGVMPTKVDGGILYQGMFCIRNAEAGKTFKDTKRGRYQEVESRLLDMCIEYLQNKNNVQK
jgi:hypothetical protein